MPSQESILGVDDDPAIAEFCERVLSRNGYACHTLTDPLAVLPYIRGNSPDLVIVDLFMPGKDGISVLKEIKEEAPEALVIIFTGNASVESAVKAMKHGAFYFVTKPFSVDLMLLTVERALEKQRLEAEDRTLRTQLLGKSGYGGMIGQSEAMQKIYRIIEKVAPSDASILIHGESGTGKELIAQAIHANRVHAEGRFVPVDCVALPENLMESELFGHEKGAFSGAGSRKVGLFEDADSGTFFMDEITALSTDLQAKLLRTLQERKFPRVGGRELI